MSSSGGHEACPTSTYISLMGNHRMRWELGWWALQLSAYIHVDPLFTSREATVSQSLYPYQHTVAACFPTPSLLLRAVPHVCTAAGSVRSRNSSSCKLTCQVRKRRAFRVTCSLVPYPTPTADTVLGEVWEPALWDGVEGLTVSWDTACI